MFKRAESTRANSNPSTGLPGGLTHCIARHGKGKGVKVAFKRLKNLHDQKNEMELLYGATWW